MPTKDKLRKIVREKLAVTIAAVNAALRGEHLDLIEPVLRRIGRGNQLPHWYGQLREHQTFPNMDGKTVGSVVEMVLVAVLESFTFKGIKISPLRINPARGIDLPDLDLGVKSPSENYCTSEPFFSAYERLLGSDHDALVLLTDYQTAKRKPPVRLQIIKWRYLNKTQIADTNLCRIARKHRKWLVQENEAWAKKIFRFLAFVNQSDWRGKYLVRMVDTMQDRTVLGSLIQEAAADFLLQNRKRLKRDRLPIPESDLQALQRISTRSPIEMGVVDEADNWVLEIQKDLGRAPNDNEWSRLLASPLNAIIGMSFALQWRYNFGRLFGDPSEERESDGDATGTLTD